MPTYDYVCEKCNHRFEEMQSFKDEPLKICPKCHEAALRRLFGTGAAILFKGSGFYETDYRSESYKKAAQADKQASESKPAAASSTSNGATTSDSKPATATTPSSGSGGSSSSAKT